MEQKLGTYTELVLELAAEQLKGSREAQEKNKSSGKETGQG